MLVNGTIIANRYEIIGKIGTGGTADVYKAKCHKLNRFVAIKVLKREFSEDKNFITKFRIEAQSAAGMAHANIVNVYDVGDEYGIYYIVMELVEGITLKQYIDKKGALEYKEAISIAIQIAQGIEVAHKHNIIHRDIKPQNIIISREGKVKVTDFGIAKVTSSDTVNSMAMGSVHYISPEQARGGFSDITSDIYSFGITLYEMCAGRVPFNGESTVAVALMHIQNEITPPTVYNPSIPVSVEKIILKCTQKRMDRRYSSATELITDMKRSLVTPYEDFVNLQGEVDNSPTVLFTQQQIDEINEKSQQYEASSFQNYSSEPELDLKMVTSSSIDLSYLTDDSEYEEHHYVASDDDEEEDDDVVAHDGNKMDKLMVWFGIAVAAVIVIITVVVCVKVLTTFNSAGNNINEIESESNVVTVAQEQGIEVPSLYGLTATEAQTMLNERGLGFKQVKENNDLMEKGRVIGQNVEAGLFVEKNTQVIVTVSDGPKTFDMISVLGMTEANALDTLKSLGLVPTTEYEYSNEYEQGTVIKTVPVASSKVKAGDSVVITVSRGRQNNECIVPNILGLDESEAREAIDKAGLVAQSGGSVTSATVEAGKVVAQNYPADTKLAAGTIVEYVLSSGSDDSNYTGHVTIIKDWYAVNPEGYDVATGTKEVQAVLRQNKEFQDYTKEILPFTNASQLGDAYEINFEGAVNGVSLGTVDVYVKYTWTDPATGETKTETKNVMSVSTTLSEVN